MFKKISLTFILAAIIFAPNVALADGMAFYRKPGASHDYVDEKNQCAYIAHEKGLEKMIIGVDLDVKSSDEIAWIFPVPANPAKVVIDIVDKYPSLRGENIKEAADLKVKSIFRSIRDTQIYPFIVRNMFMPFGSVEYSHKREVSFGTSLGGADQGAPSDLVVHERLEKKGMTTEVITAKFAASIYKYLKDKGMQVDEGSLPILDNYIGKDFTFVVSWISPGYSHYSRQSNNERAVFVTFPTRKIYYPMLLTSVYGSHKIPIDIRVIGLVTPRLSGEIKSYAKVNYYAQSHLHLPEALETFYSKQSKRIYYTKIDINAPSKYFTRDLTFSKAAPLRVSLDKTIAYHPFWFGLIIHLILSFIAGLLAGLLVYKKALKYALLGLANIISLIGIILGIIFLKDFKTKLGPLDENTQNQITRLKELGFRIKKPGRKPAYILWFTFIFLVLSGVVQAIF